MARLDTKAFEDYPRTLWWLERLPTEYVKGVEQKAKYAEDPVPFRMTYLDYKSATTVQRQIINAFPSIDVSVFLETRDILSFKINDVILDNLDMTPDERVMKSGHRFLNYSMVTGADSYKSKDYDKNAIRGIDNIKKTIMAIDA